jgi:hypothetical protein
MASSNNSEPAGFVRYQHELPEWERISKAWNLLEKYSGIPPEQIEPHLRAIVCIVPIFTCHISSLPSLFIHPFIRPSKSDDGAQYLHLFPFSLSFYTTYLPTNLRQPPTYLLTIHPFTGYFTYLPR